MTTKRGIGVFSDIHGNRRAFAAVIETVKRRQDLEWLCLGDVVGWFFRPVECVLMLKALVDEGLVRAVVPGNHDLMALDVFADKPQMIDRMLATAFSAGMLAQSPEARAFLSSWKQHVLEGDSWLAAHHSPFGLPHGAEPPSAEHYGVMEQDFPAQLPAWARCPKPVVLTGHGHVPYVYGMPRHPRHVILDAPIKEQRSGTHFQAMIGDPSPCLEDVTTWRPKPDDHRTIVPVQPGWRYWVRNGTVGGPYSDGRVTGHWTEYLPGEAIILHRVDYDTSELEADIRDHRHLMTYRDTWQKRVLQLLPAHVT